MTWNLIGKVGPYDTKAEVDAKVLVETNRAKAAEESLQNEIDEKADITALTAESERAQNAETALQQDIDTNAGKTAELDADLTIANDKIAGIESKIPETASSTNKLATIADVEGTGITEVKHDDSLIGLGTTAEPLKVDIPVPAGGTSGQVLTKTDDSLEWRDTKESADNNGLEGDYATTYGIVDETTSGLPYIKAVGSTVVVIPAGLVMDIPGVPGLTTNTGNIEYEVVSTDNPTLFLAQGTVIEATDVFFQVEEPEDGTTGYAAWWNGTTWQFKSNDTGNVWRPANAVRIAKTVFTNGSLTRLCFIGCRVLNKQEWLPKSGGSLTGDLVAPTKVTDVYTMATVLSLRVDTTTANGTPLTVGLTSNGNQLYLPATCFVNGVAPRTNNSGHLGGIFSKWNSVYATKINNGADIKVPTTGGTMALLENLTTIESNIDSLYEEVGEKLDTTSAESTYATKTELAVAATSGTLVGSYWFGKTNASATVPAPTLPGQNYYDFTTGQVYKSIDGTTWALDTTYTPPTDVDVQIGITSKFWDIPEQENQHGGVAKWSHTNANWSYYPEMYESIPAGGASLPLLTRLISDHKFNDVSYLNANTFSWQSGAIYVAAYQHLVDDLSTAGAVQTETIEGIEISYEVATDGHRICLADQEDAVSQLYQKTGNADFYIVDTENARFKLPRAQKCKLIRAVKNNDGSWYNLYSDGWVEQGGICPSLGYTVVLPIEMADTNYPILGTARNTSGNYPIRVQNITTTSFKLNSSAAESHTISWLIGGYASNTFLANQPVQYEYYYVGNFEQSAIQQTAGINAEMFNDKADTDANNISESGFGKIVSMCVPDWSNPIGNVGNNYTAPKDGIYLFACPNNNSERSITINGNTFTAAFNSYGARGGYPIPLGKGDNVIIGNTSLVLDNAWFIPYKGAI